jgi:intracellular sulfur oxidation DsrE/DsrF family protein
MKAIWLLVLFIVTLFATEPEKKALFGCKSGEAKSVAKTLDAMMHLVDYYEKNKNSYDIVMVAQGECVKFMLSDTDGTEYKNEDIPLDIELKLGKLKGKARLEQCAVTLDRKQIAYSKVRKEVKIVPSATVSTVDYQLKGYAYLP